MQELGNVITVFGILVTFVAYFGQHSRVSLRDLEPGLSSRWTKVWVWVRRKLGLTKSATVKAGTAHGSLTFTGTAIGLAWSPIQPSDDIAVRAEKLERNLDGLRANLAEMRKHDQERFREVTERLTERVDGLDHLVAARYEEDQTATTTAMRWEVRGLLITLVGAGLSIFG